VLQNEIGLDSQGISRRRSQDDYPVVFDQYDVTADRDLLGPSGEVIKQRTGGESERAKSVEATVQK